jgi:pyruvate,water dikinase
MEKEVREGAPKFIRWFNELGKEDVLLAGGKGANLGEMFNSGFPIPPGFVVISQAYKYFLEKTELDKKIYKSLENLDIENTQALDDVAAKIREMIKSSEMPEDLKEEITENYEALEVDKEAMEKATGDALTILKRAQEPEFVAVRSSATAEDTGAASFAGQNETFLNTKGSTAVIEAVKKCWASLFTARSVYYRVKKGFKHEDVLIAVIIQKMVNSDKSGVIFSRDPVTQDENIIIEAVFGLGEGIVSGQIQPDHYVVSRDLKILSKSTANKKIALVRNSGGSTEKIKLTEERSKSPVLTDYEIKRFADYAVKLEEHYKSPQDTEFAVESGELYIVQTRPVTTLEKKEGKETEGMGEPILAGNAAAPGIGSGTVRIVHDLQELVKIKKGDVLVTEMTNPDMVVAMQKCAAIITDEGGMTSHAAIVSREMGIPCIVGTEKATKELKDGQEVTVNGYTGKIYSGRHENIQVQIKQIMPTKTKVKTIVDLPDYAERAAKTGIKQVGLTRIEGIIAESGKHPYYFVQQNKIKDYEEVVFSGVSKIAEYFDEIWVRTSDIRSDEYVNLEGAPKHVELNPMLGMHGVRFSLKHQDIMKAELLSLKRVAEKGKKIGVLLPQVISVSEVQKTKQILKEIGFNDAKIGVMIETPAAVWLIEDLCKEGIDFISFGTNDLTQFTLAIDRGNEEVQYLYHETHPSMKKSLSYVIQTCKKYGVESSICGQAGSDKIMVEFLVKQGIDSISCNADKAGEISELIADMEAKGLRGSEASVFWEEMCDMGRKKKEKGKVDEIDNLEHVKEHAEEMKEKVEEEKKEKAEEQKKKEESVKTEEKVEEKKEEYPDIDIGVDIFQQH